MPFINKLSQILRRKVFISSARKMSGPSSIDLSKDRFIWIDLELTGLDINVDHILEVACIVTKPDLSTIDEGVNLIIHQPEEILTGMDSWCVKQHHETGLTQACRCSQLSLQDAEKQIYDHIIQHTDSGTRYLAGNTVYMDRWFLKKHMPAVDNLLHYRIIDVSSLKLLCSHWYENQFEKIPPKKIIHRALDDIQQSLKELKNYKQYFFIPPGEMK